jgi:REP element-mobilizing transposase RayT
MAHSIEGRSLFVDIEDNIDFTCRFAKGLLKTGYICYTFALLKNHYHLLVRSSAVPMSKLMRALNGGYAQKNNKRHNKRGYLFQDRFKSVPCQEQDYAVQLIKYINLNPLRAGMVNSLEELKEWDWCGHGCLLGEKGTYGEVFQNRLECLRRFGDNEKDAINAYLESVIESCKNGNETAGKLPSMEANQINDSCKGWPAVIGDPEFVKKVMDEYKSNQNKIHRTVDYPSVLEKISKEVCEEYNITLADLKKKGKKNIMPQARAVFCYRANVIELIPQTVIANFLGLTISPVAVLIEKGTIICETVTAPA